MNKKQERQLLSEYIRKKLFTFDCEELKENKTKYKGDK